MVKNNLVPKRRFKEFRSAGDWELRKLGDIAEKVSVGIATSSSEYFTNAEDGVPFIKNMNIKDTKIDDSNLEYITSEFDQANKNKKLLPGDIITARTGYPGLSAVVPEHLKGAQTFTTLITRLNFEKTNPEFVAMFINAPIGMKKIGAMEAGGAQKNVNAKVLEKLNLSLPSVNEQEKIVSFINKINDTIALHQRKLEKLNSLKVAYLTEMFPTEGEKKPKRRFEGFIDAWELRKLGNITESFSGGTPQAGNSDYYGGEIPFIRSGEINDDQTELFITDEGLNNSSAKIVKKGDILYALYGATSGEVGISQINGAINQAILAIRPTKDDNSYLIVQWLLKQKEAIISTYLQGGQGNLSGSIVKELTLMLPKDKTEQAKIEVFFKQLDDTIALHQRKLEKSQNLKKAYLNEIFV